MGDAGSGFENDQRFEYLLYLGRYAHALRHRVFRPINNGGDWDHWEREGRKYPCSCLHHVQEWKDWDADACW